MTIQEAIEKKFLEDRIIYIRPIAKVGAQGIKDKSHIAYFKMDNASDKYCLKTDEKTKRIVNPFKSEEQMKYFSEVIGKDLNPYMDDNDFWNDYTISITKTPELMSIGKKLDLSSPREMLDYLVLKTWVKEFASSWEDRFNNSGYRYAFVDSTYEEKKALDDFDIAVKLGEYIGAMRNSPKKMRDFINIYYQIKHKAVELPDDYRAEQLVVELKKIMETDKSGFIKLIDDPDYDSRVLVQKAIDKDVVVRKGVSSYEIPGMEGSLFSYKELIEQFKLWHEKKTEPIYLKIMAITK